MPQRHSFAALYELYTFALVQHVFNVSAPGKTADSQMEHSTLARMEPTRRFLEEDGGLPGRFYVGEFSIPVFVGIPTHGGVPRQKRDVLLPKSLVALAVFRSGPSEGIRLCILLPHAPGRHMSMTHSRCAFGLLLN